MLIFNANRYLLGVSNLSFIGREILINRIAMGDLVETCFGMNRAAILALSIFLVALQTVLCGEPRGKCWLYSPDAFQV